MYPLFDLVRLLSVQQDTESLAERHPYIVQFAWRQVEDLSLLALICSNGHVLIRWSVHGQRSEMKLLPWLEDRPIVASCFDPSATWLLVITTQLDMFIVPALALMDPESKVNQLWKVDDATHIKFKKAKGFPSALCWWHTFTGIEVAIIGTTLGEIFFVDLSSKHLLTSTSIQSYVVKFDLVYDDHQLLTYLLVTSKKGSQWKLLLEKNNRSEWSEDHHLATGKSSEDDQFHYIVSIIDQAAGYQDLFWPVYFPQFGRSVQLSAQYAKGRQLIAAQCCRTCSYQIYDCSIQHSPLFVYKLPLGAHNTVFTDRIIFLNTWQNGKKLFLLSNQKAETLLDSDQALNPDAIIQTFDLPCEEKVLGIVKINFPFYWHEKQEASLGLSEAELCSDLSPHSIHISRHTVFDGCLVITDAAVYECRPRISPERYFLELALHPLDSSNVDSLAVSLGLDFNNLFALAADHLLTRGHFNHAVRLFKMAKYPYVKRVATFASYGRISEVMTYVQYIMKRSNQDLNTSEAKQLADIAFHGFVYQIQKDGMQDNDLVSSFREFLQSNFLYNELEALKILAEWRWTNLLLEVAKARGLVVEGLELMIQHGIYNVDVSFWKDLVQKGFGAYLAHIGQGVFLHCLSAEDLVDLMCLRPPLAVLQVDILHLHLRKLDIERLIKLAETFDPSKSAVKGHLACHQVARGRTFSQGSMSSLLSLNFGENPNLDVSYAATQRMVDFFFDILLVLNKKRDKLIKPSELNKDLQPRPLIPEPVSFVEDKSKKSEKKLLYQSTLIGCGTYHVALVRNGDLYVWGRARAGCLGHGDITVEDSILPVSRVETIHMLKIRVLAVACGGEHILALSSQGVYSWGSSKYGQVGVGTRHRYSRPMLVEALSNERCVKVDCGQYHSIVLTEEGKVYTWGWGIHGQLGHGDAESLLVPTPVTSLSTVKEIRSIQIAAGYAHSLVLNQQGDVYAFGCGYFGQLGLGHGQKRSLPTHVPLPEKISVVATKSFHSLAVTQDSNVYMWGVHPNVVRYTAQMNRRSHQGLESSDEINGDYLNPILVDTSNVAGKIIEVSCGNYHSLLLTSDGTVYSWGRNTDGQLGFVSYQNVLCPTQVTAISDTNIVHIHSGSDYNIAVNNNGELWGWGKNDYGQLIHPTDKENTARRKPKSILNRDDAEKGSATSVRVPISLQGIPSRKGANFNVSGSPDSVFGSDDSSQIGRLNIIIPDLASVGHTKYGRQVVPVLLRYIPEWCQSINLLQKCIHHKDWKMAIDITLHMKQYSQALAFHLMMIGDAVDDLKKEVAVQLSIQVLEFYISRLVNQEMPVSSKDGCIHFALLQVLSHWNKYSLSSANLEKFFDQYFDSLAPCLGSILLRDESLMDEFYSSLRSSDQPRATSYQYKVTFSTTFLLKLVSNIIHKIHTEVNKPSPKTSLVVKKMLQAFNERAMSGIMPSDKLIPHFQLWNDIVQNIRKMSVAHPSVAISYPELQHLQLTSALATNANSTDSDHHLADNLPSTSSTEQKPPVLPSKIVAFTCGHHFLEQSFKNDTLVNLNIQLAKDQRLPRAAVLLTECYSKFGLLPLACPRCVMQTISTI